VRKLPVVSSTEVMRALEKAGFVYAPKRGKGSIKRFIKSMIGDINFLLLCRGEESYLEEHSCLFFSRRTYQEKILSGF